MEAAAVSRSERQRRRPDLHAEITQTEGARYFFVQGLSIYSPVHVAIAAEDPAVH